MLVRDTSKWSRHFTKLCKSVHPWERVSEIQIQSIKKKCQKIGQNQVCYCCMFHHIVQQQIIFQIRVLPAYGSNPTNLNLYVAGKLLHKCLCGKPTEGHFKGVNLRPTLKKLVWYVSDSIQLANPNFHWLTVALSQCMHCCKCFPMMRGFFLFWGKVWL